MKVDLTRAVSNYKKVNIYDCINEALVNSLQTNSSEISVTIESTNSPQGELYNNKIIISKIIIQDNGNGFNEDNRKSFLHLYSDHKEKDGCKGIGRLPYLKGFKNVQILSKQNNELVKFDFTKELNEEQLNPIKIVEDTKQTTLTLENPINEETYNLDKIYKEIFNHIYPFIFLKNSKCVININDIKITKDDVKNIENAKFNVTKTINNKEQSIEFNLWYRFQESDKTILDDFICINNRPMQHFSNKPLSLKLYSKEKYHTTFLLESDWINKLETNQYHKFENIEDEEGTISDEDSTLDNNMYLIEDLYKNKDLIKQIWKDVKQELIKKLNEIMILKFPEMQKENKKIINNLKEKYPHYADFIENDSISFVNEKQLLKNAREQALQEEDKLENDNVSINEIQKCVSNDLIRYILHRQKIIDELDKLNKNGESVEDKIHTLIYPKNKDTETLIDPVQENNLWIIDDKFMSNSYIASHKTLKEIAKKTGYESENGGYPDLTIFFDNDNTRKAVIVELKSFGRRKRETEKQFAQWQYSGISQLRDEYAVELQKRFTNIEQIYYYLITKINKDLLNKLEGEGYKSLFSTKDGVYFMYYPVRKIYIYIISSEAIIADANARNKTFLDIIKKSKITQE